MGLVWEEHLNVPLSVFLKDYSYTFTYTEALKSKNDGIYITGINFYDL